MLGRHFSAVLDVRGLHGVLYVPLDEHEGWHVRLAREMKAAELSLDLNRIL